MKTTEKKINKAEQTAIDFITAKLQETKMLPWAKPWTASFQLPYNYTTGNRFSGLNLIMCMFFDTPEFATFNAITNELNGKVKKGSKSIPLLRPATVYYLGEKKLTFKQYNALNDEKKKECRKFTYFVTYRVFNLESHTEGIDIKREDVKVFTPELRKDCDNLINAYNKDCPIKIQTSDSAYYSPIGDYIVLPKPEQFEKTEMFYSTAFHEMVHSTGHAKRLKRKGVAEFGGKGSQSYAKEELVAEIGASILNAHYGTFDNTKHLNAAYVKGWLKALANDPQMIVEASKDSKKAIDYIIKKGA